MRNVNVDGSDSKPVDGAGFILTMRNVNGYGKTMAMSEELVLY